MAIFPSNGSAVVPYEFYFSLPSPFHERYLYMPKPPFLYRAPEFFPIELLERRPTVKWHMCLDVLDYTLEVKKKNPATLFNPGHWGLWVCCLMAQASMCKCQLQTNQDTPTHILLSCCFQIIFLLFK